MVTPTRALLPIVGRSWVNLFVMANEISASNTEAIAILIAMKVNGGAYGIP